MTLETLKDFTDKYIKDMRLNKDFFCGLKIWIGISKNYKLKEIREVYQNLLRSYGITILDCEINAIIEGKVQYDALLFFAVTPGVSARAIELVAIYDSLKNIKENSPIKNNIQKEKMYICMPSEYKEGYIERRLSSAGKTISKFYFDDLNEKLLQKSVRTLINIANIKETDMKTKFDPTILIVTALSKEFQAVKDLLDNPRYDPSLKEEKIQYPHYKIGESNIVLAMSGMENNLSSAIGTKMLEIYPSIEHVLMVGVAGGIPNVKDATKHIRLGDIVISGEKGIIQYDMGKETKNGFEYNFNPRPVSALLYRNAEIIIQDTGKKDFKFWNYFDKLLDIDEDMYKRQKQDLLKDTPWDEESSAKLPDAPKGYNNDRPRIHIGAIASGNSVLKHAEARNKLVKEFPAVKAVEMEASGLADASWLKNKHCFVIRGICDYCNPDKHKEWQNYAVGVAAAFAIELIETLD